MATCLIDTNVLIDATASTSPWHLWSTTALRVAMESGSVAINPVIYSELAMNYEQPAQLEQAFPAEAFLRLDLPWACCFAAGEAHLRYRNSGGRRERTLPDFLIGAHAQGEGFTLITRDASRYRSYFPDLALIEPRTHYANLTPGH